MYEHTKIKTLSLFAGIGGIDLGLEATGYFETVQFVEYDPYCQHILKRHWPDVPVWGDVKTFDPDSCGEIDCIVGGYPCQSFSVAGKQKGTQDDRHLWPWMFEIIKHKRPSLVLCENVSGHIALGLDEVLLDLEGEGYSTRAFVIPASAVDANHKRERVWIVAYSNNTGDRTSQRRTDKDRQKINEEQAEQPQSQSSRQSTNVAYANTRDVQAGCKRSGGVRSQSEEEEQSNNIGSRSEIERPTDVANSQSFGSDGRKHKNYNEQRDRQVQIRRESSTKDVFDTHSQRGLSWKTGQQATENVGQQSRGEEHRKGSIERGLGGVVDGVPSWLDEPDIPRVTTNQTGRVQRLKMLGNAVVPQVVYQLGLAMKELWDEV